MTKKHQIYKCNICGNIVEVLDGGVGELICCGKAMNLQKENEQDASLEKHIPVIKKTDKGEEIIVGEVEHPMKDEHYIEWIEIMFADGRVLRKNLKPGDKPSFLCPKGFANATIRAYCNLHGLWVLKK